MVLRFIVHVLLYCSSAAPSPLFYPEVGGAFRHRVRWRLRAKQYRGVGVEGGRGAQSPESSPIDRYDQSSNERFTCLNDDVMRQERSKYEDRFAEIKQYNKERVWRKRGISITSARFIMSVDAKPAAVSILWGVSLLPPPLVLFAPLSTNNWSPNIA